MFYFNSITDIVPLDTYRSELRSIIKEIVRNLLIKDEEKINEHGKYG